MGAGGRKVAFLRIAVILCVFEAGLGVEAQARTAGKWAIWRQCGSTTSSIGVPTAVSAD
ncbi:unnamed protein product, partial [Phaeothamnion confervicola]